MRLGAREWPQGVTLPSGEVVVRQVKGHIRPGSDPEEPLVLQEGG